MRKPRQKDICEAVDPAPHALHKECPIFLTLSLIANKWSVRILASLLAAEKHTLRFSEIKRAMEHITQRELTKHLREFEKAGIVERTVYPEVPLRVEYRLTKLGRSLWEPIESLSAWARQHGKTIQKKRAAFGTQEP